MRKLGVVLVLIGVLNGCGGSTEVERFVAWGSSNSTITLAWEPVVGTTGYSIERSAQGGAYAPVATLEAGIESYLDAELAEGKYAYRLTAIGTAEPVRESETATTADLPLRTADDRPIGVPVQQIVDSAGATIAMPLVEVRAIIPAGALPDGSAVMLSSIESPAATQDAAVEIAADAPFTQPVTITFGLTADEAATPGNLAVAVQEPNGTWVTRPATLGADGASLSAILPAEVAQRSRPATPRPARRVMKFRRVVIAPGYTFVKHNTKTILEAQARFSDDPCEDAGDDAWICRGLEGRPSFPEPVIEDRPLENSKGEWKNLGPGNIFVTQSESSIIHSAPATKPADTVWRVTFTLAGNARHEAATIFNFTECLARNGKAPADTCEDSWTGSSTSLFPNDASPIYRLTADVTWIYDPATSEPDYTEYFPMGTVTLESQDPCLTFTPSTQAITKVDGMLALETRDGITTYFGAGANISWIATVFNSCTDPPSSGAANIGGGWFSGMGELTDPATIEDTSTQGGQTFTYSFKRTL